MPPATQVAALVRFDGSIDRDYDRSGAHPLRVPCSRRFWLRLAILAFFSPFVHASFAQSYSFSIFAGSVGVVNGSSNVDGKGAEARFFGATGLAIDAQENLYVVDQNNHTIRKITQGGYVSTIAGTPGVPGFADGPASSARFRYPAGITIDAQGNLYVADGDNHAIRRISRSGLVTTIAVFPDVAMPPNGVIFQSFPVGIALDSAGTLFVVDGGHYVIRKINPDGSFAIHAGAQVITTGGVDGQGGTARFITPRGCTIDAKGELFVADHGNYAIRRISLDRTVTTIAGHLSISAGDGDFPSYYSGYVDGTGAGVRFDGPQFLAFDGRGFLYVTDQTRIRRISPEGFVTTIAGGPHKYTSRGQILPPYYAEGAGSKALFSSLTGIVVTPSGTIFVADGARIWKGIPDPTTPSSRLINLSVRAKVDPGDGGLIVGVVTSDTFAKRIVLRGIGPSLTAFGVPDALRTVTLRLFDSAGAQISAGGSWGGNAGIAAAFARVGAFPLSSGSSDAAAAQMLPGGLHTVHVNAMGDAGGVALAEVYDDDPDVPSTRLVNLSGRARVDAASGNLTAGWVISGSASKTVLIRGVGPTLAGFGVADVLASPELTLFNDRGTILQRNSGWGGDSALLESFGRVGAFPFPKTSSDCAILVTLPPGAYTAQIRSSDGSSGVALVEVFEMP